MYCFYLVVNVFIINVMIVAVIVVVVLCDYHILMTVVLVQTWGDRMFGPVNWLVSVFVACSALGAVNGSMFSGGR